MRKFLCLAMLTGIFCLLPTVVVALTSEYSTDGCGEYIRQNDEGAYGPIWRIVYRCCGSTCWQATPWLDGAGPQNICGSTIIQRHGDGPVLPVHIDANGNALISVAPGKGGSIINSTTGCYPFTGNGGDVIIIAAGI